MGQAKWAQNGAYLSMMGTILYAVGGGRVEGTARVANGRGQGPLGV